MSCSFRSECHSQSQVCVSTRTEVWTLNHYLIHFLPIQKQSCVGVLKNKKRYLRWMFSFTWLSCDLIDFCQDNSQLAPQRRKIEINVLCQSSPWQCGYRCDQTHFWPHLSVMLGVVRNATDQKHPNKGCQWNKVKVWSHQHIKRSNFAAKSIIFLHRVHLWCTLTHKCVLSTGSKPSCHY